MAEGGVRPILVGVDGSPESVAAARWAMAEAAMRGRPLVIVCVYYWPAPALPLSRQPADLTEDKLRQEADRVVADVIAAIRDPDVDVPITASTVIGLPAYKLIELSERVSMLVVGHRGHGGFTGLRLGSVAANVAAHSSCPVAVIRSGSPKVTAVRTVLVGVDGPESADAVLGFAFDEASRRECDLRAMTAHERPNWLTGSEVRDWPATAAANLSALVRPWQEKFPQVPVEQLVSPERPAAALIGAAAQADLLIVGSRGHGGFAGLLLGSVSQQVINHAPVPVVVVR